MNRKLIISIRLFLLLSVFMLINSCQKDSSVPNVDSEETLISDAKSFFEGQVLKGDKGTKTLAKKKQSFRSEFAKAALWDQAKIKTISIGDVVTVPLKYTGTVYTKSGKAKRPVALENLSYLMVYPNKVDGKMYAELVTWIPDDEYWDDKARKKKPYRGTIIVEDWQGNFIKGFRFGKDGIRPLTLPQESGGVSTSALMQHCYTVEWSTCARYGNGAWYCQVGGYDSYCESWDPSSGGSPGTGGGGGSGSGGGGTPNPGDYPPSDPNNPCDGSSSPSVSAINPCDDPDPSTPPTDVINQVQDPCLQYMVNHVLFRSPQSVISNLIQRTFNQQTVFNLRIMDSERIAFTTDGITTASLNTTTNPMVLEADVVITLNRTVLKNASQEYIAATILHEAVHAYMYEQGNLGAMQHEAMYIGYAQTIASTLKAMYPNLTENEAWGLSVGGLEKTWSFNIDASRLPTMIGDVSVINASYRLYGAGTRCQ